MKDKNEILKREGKIENNEWIKKWGRWRRKRTSAAAAAKEEEEEEEEEDDDDDDDDKKKHTEVKVLVRKQECHSNKRMKNGVQ